MASRQQEQRPYSTHNTSDNNAQQYYHHPAQASQYSLHTPTDPNPPNSSFRSPPPRSPRLPSDQFPPSPGFLQMEHQRQQPTGVPNPQQRLTRVFDGEESPVEYEFAHNQSQGREQQAQRTPVEYPHQVPEGLEYAHDEQYQGHEQQYQAHEQQYEGHEQQYQGHEQQYQGHEQQYHQSPTEYHQHQGQEPQYQQPPAEYAHQQQGYDSIIQQQYSTPVPSPGFPPSQFDRQSQQFIRASQVGPSPQYASAPQTPSFPPPPHSTYTPHSPSFPPQPHSATFPPRSPSFPPPPHSPSFPPPPRSPSFTPLPQSPSYPAQTLSFPPPPTSSTYPSTMPTSTPPPGGLGMELTTQQPRPHPPPDPIGTPAYSPGGDGAPPTPMTPKVPMYTPGGGSGPNGGTHAPGQIGHPNQQHGKEEYHHGLCDCFSDISTCCMGYWCPCILYSRTNHRLKTSPNSNLNDFHSCNGHCVGFCVLAPLSWIFTTIQRGRIRDKYKLEGTLMSDCGKAYCCVMCTLVQDEREVTDREDERRRNAGPGSGVVGDGGYRRHDSMLYGRS